MRVASNVCWFKACRIQYAHFAPTVAVCWCFRVKSSLDSGRRGWLSGLLPSSVDRACSRSSDLGQADQSLCMAAVMVVEQALHEH